MKLHLLRGLPALAATSLLVWSCSSGGGGGGGGGSGTVAFHADLQALPDFSKDTGLQPPGSPVQLQLQVESSGTIAIDAEAAASGSASAPVLTALTGTGKLALSGGFALKGTLVVDQTGLPKYDGPIPGLDNVSIPFQGNESFDPFLLSGSATVHAPIPPTDLPGIPLPGGLPGSLIIKIAEGSTVDFEFHGTCAAISGSQAQYTGEGTRGGSLVLEPRIELDLPIGGTKTFDIPKVEVPIALPSESIDLGTQTVSFGSAPASGENATVGACSGDGGLGGSGGSGGSGGTGGTGGSSGDGSTSCSGNACSTPADCCSAAPDCTQGICTASACTQCQSSSCGAEVGACKDNPECAGLLSCVEACGSASDYQSCETNCMLSHPYGQDAFVKYEGCAFANCGAACGLPACLLQLTPPSCDQCVATQCADACQTASQSADCMSKVYCYGACAGIQCTVDCAQFPAAACQVFDDCHATKCAVECGA